MSRSRAQNSIIQYCALGLIPACLVCGVLGLIGMPDDIREKLKTTPQPINIPKTTVPSQNFLEVTTEELDLFTAVPTPLPTEAPISGCEPGEIPTTLSQFTPATLWTVCTNLGAENIGACANGAHRPNQTAQELIATEIGPTEPVCIDLDAIEP